MELAIFKDCQRLVDSFVKQGDRSFPAFCQQWLNLKFNYIWAAQSSNVQVMNTTLAALWAAKRIASNSEAQPPRRLGGLFLMYALYYKQPTKEFIKIEVSPATWENIKTFVVGSDHAEAQHIFLKLFKEHAFRFTALDYPVGLEGLADYVKLDEQHMNNVLGTNRPIKEELVGFKETKRMLPALVQLEAKYNENKFKLVETGEVADNALQPTTIFRELAAAFHNMQKGFKEQAAPCRRSELKRKAYHLAKGQKKPETSSDNANDGEVASTSSALPISKHVSSRWVFAEQLPAHISEEMEEEQSTSESESEAAASDEEFNPVETTLGPETEQAAVDLAELLKDT